MNNRPTHSETKWIYRNHFRSQMLFIWLDSVRYYNLLGKFGIKVCGK